MIQEGRQGPEGAVCRSFRMQIAWHTRSRDGPRGGGVLSGESPSVMPQQFVAIRPTLAKLLAINGKLLPPHNTNSPWSGSINPDLTMWLMRKPPTEVDYTIRCWPLFGLPLKWYIMPANPWFNTTKWSKITLSNNSTANDWKKLCDKKYWSNGLPLLHPCWYDTCVYGHNSEEPNCQCQC